MVASAVFVLDLKGKVLISRNYRGDVPPAAVDKFMQLLLEQEESFGADSSGYAPPVLTNNGINYMYNVYCTLPFLTPKMI